MLSNRFQCGPPMTSYCGAEWPRAMILLLAEASAARIESTSVFARQYDEQGAVAGREDAADVAALLVAERFVPHVGNQRLDGLFERRVGVLAVNQYDPLRPLLSGRASFAYFRAGSGAIWKRTSLCV